MKGILFLTLLMTIELSMALECFKCTNNVDSDKNEADCISNVEQGGTPTETCADGVTSCYIRDDFKLYRKTGKIRTVAVERGCLPADVQCDEGSLEGDDLMTYTSCCTDDHCNEAHLVGFPEKA